MNRARLAGIAAAALLIGTPAASQMQSGGYDGVTFVGAVRSADGDKAMELLQAHPTVINARDDKGETGLIVAVSKRADDWTMFLLQKGADPNLAARNGDTPLIAAARIGYNEAAAELLNRKARVDAANRMGETALIIAVQQRNAVLAKLLLERGANPDRTDAAAGLSARDYAKRDGRARDILALIEGAKKPQPKSDKLDDFKL